MGRGLKIPWVGRGRYTMGRVGQNTMGRFSTSVNIYL